MAGIRVGRDERALQDLVRAAGGAWDHTRRLWHLSRRVARVLHIANRITEL